MLSYCDVRLVTFICMSLSNTALTWNTLKWLPPYPSQSCVLEKCRAQDRQSLPWVAKQGQHSLDWRTQMFSPKDWFPRVPSVRLYIAVGLWANKSGICKVSKGLRVASSPTSYGQNESQWFDGSRALDWKAAYAEKEERDHKQLCRRVAAILCLLIIGPRLGLGDYFPSCNGTKKECINPGESSRGFFCTFSITCIITPIWH